MTLIFLQTAESQLLLFDVCSSYTKMSTIFIRLDAAIE